MKNKMKLVWHVTYMMEHLYENISSSHPLPEKIQQSKMGWRKIRPTEQAERREMPIHPNNMRNCHQGTNSA